MSRSFDPNALIDKIATCLAEGKIEVINYSGNSDKAEVPTSVLSVPTTALSIKLTYTQQTTINESQVLNDMNIPYYIYQRFFKTNVHVDMQQYEVLAIWKQLPDAPIGNLRRAVDMLILLSSPDEYSGTDITAVDLVSVCGLLVILLILSTKHREKNEYFELMRNVFNLKLQVIKDNLTISQTKHFEALPVTYKRLFTCVLSNINEIITAICEKDETKARQKLIGKICRVTDYEMYILGNKSKQNKFY